MALIKLSYPFPRVSETLVNFAILWHLICVSVLFIVQLS